MRACLKKKIALSLAALTLGVGIAASTTPASARFFFGGGGFGHGFHHGFDHGFDFNGGFGHRFGLNGGFDHGFGFNSGFGHRFGFNGGFGHRFGHRFDSRFGNGPGYVGTDNEPGNFQRKSGYIAYGALSADGRQAPTGNSFGALQLWSVASNAPVGAIAAKVDGLQAIALQRDGERLLAGGNDGTLKIFKSDSGELLAIMIANVNSEWVTITPEGFFDCSEHGADLLSIVRGGEFYAIDQFYQALYRPDLVEEKLAGDPQGKVREAAAKIDIVKAIAGGDAPKVAINSPADRSIVASDSVTVEAALTDQGGGVGKIEWRVNGVTLGVEERGLQAAAAPAPASVKRTLSLGVGDNRIEVVAYNAQGLIASPPAAITITRMGAEAAKPRLYVVSVGVNSYADDRLRLSFAATDAQSVSDAMRKAGGKLYKSVEATDVDDADATAAHLDQVFTDLSRKVRPEDVFVFYLAGHGKTVDARYYFVPQNLRYEGEDSIVKGGIGQDRLQEWFARIQARRSVLLFDTCESGSMTGERAAERGLKPLTDLRSKISLTAVHRLTQAIGRTVLTASTDDGPALEGYHGHGVFTYVALEAIGQAATEADGSVRVTDLAAFIDREVPDLSYQAFGRRQIPQMKIVGANFALLSKTVVLADADADASRSSAPIAPAKLTHVVITPTAVRKAANAGSAVVLQLPPGAVVELVQSSEGWVLIARDGKTLGYVVERALAKMQ